MPKKNNAPSAKKQVAATRKLITESRRQAKKDLAAQWKFLRSIGAYHTKESAAQSRLTDSRIRAIKKKMAEIQKQKMYRKGNVIPPVEFSARKTKTGRTVFDYHLNKNFAFVKTKKKPSAIEGVKKVGRGFIIEKTRPGAKVRVNRRGDIIEIMGNERRIKRRYKGKDLLALIEGIKKNKMKFRKHDFLELHFWGQPTVAIGSPADAAHLMMQYIEDNMASMNDDRLRKFLAHTYVEIVKRIDN